MGTHPIFESDFDCLTADVILEGKSWFIIILVSVGLVFILLIVACFVQHSKTGKYPVQNKTMDMMVDEPAPEENKNLLPPHSPSPCKIISPSGYVSEMRKVSSESDSIVGFGEDGNVTR